MQQILQRTGRGQGRSFSLECDATNLAAMSQAQRDMRQQRLRTIALQNRDLCQCTYTFWRYTLLRARVVKSCLRREVG